MKTFFATLGSMLFCLAVYAQQMTVTGTVTGNGKTLQGATVTVKGTKSAVVTNAAGKYTINTAKGSVLVFSIIGYERKEIKVTQQVHNVSLDVSKQALQDVVVSGRSVIKDVKKFSPPSVTVDCQVVEECSAQMVMAYCAPTDKKVTTRSAINPHDYEGTEQYKGILENQFIEVSAEPLSTFSINVDAASYGNMRRYLNQGQLPPADAMRTEELVNYFSYDYPRPASGAKDPVRITAEAGRCPWNPQNRLVRIGLKAQEIADDKLPASNLVFLIDVSGSMYGHTRLGMVKSSLKLLVNNLRDKDRVAIVVYAGSAGEVLPSTSGADRQRIREALDNLTAGGSTAGGAGIQLAYSVARKNFVKNGNNRVILCTDGDFNVGVSSPEGLEKLIEKERQSGVFLTVLGYGMGNYKDNRLQTLSEKGNGNYAYIDNLQEANKVLVQEFGGTMYAVAKDVKLQVEFNPARVKAYRLVGYESRLLKKEDFNNDAIDAGEMGAGHTVTALYEVVPSGSNQNYTGSVDPLKYQPIAQDATPVARYTDSPELLTVKLRYKEPAGSTSQKIEVPLTDRGGDQVSADFRFASAVAMFAQLMRDSQFRGNATFDSVIELARQGLGEDTQGYRREFVRLAEAAKGIK